MKILEFLNHDFKLWKDGSIYKIEPILFEDLNRKISMGEIHLDRQELSEFIVELTELLHGK